MRANVKRFSSPLNRMIVRHARQIGVEYALTRNWSAKLEYDFMDFGTARFGFNLVPDVPNVPGAHRRSDET
jgi:opacity protein-like surface antigen